VPFKKSAVLSLLVAAVSAPAQAAPTCPVTSPVTAWTGATLETGTTRSGVAYDGAGQRLQLQPAAGYFSSTSLGITDKTVYAATADFDQDGWADFAGAGESTGFLRVYENHTYENPAPDWNQPTALRAPNFVVARQLVANTNSAGTRPVAAGDFDGNGWPDVFNMTGSMGARPTAAQLYLNRAVNDASGFPQFQAGYTPFASGTTVADLGYQSSGGSSLQVLDFNGDRKLDLLVGSGEGTGVIRVFLNTCTLVANPVNPPAAPAPLPCSNAPTFTFASTLIANLGFTGTGRLPVFGYVDVDGDGVRDLVAGAPSCCSTAAQRLRLWKGLVGGGLSTTPQAITFQGAATVVLVEDFSGDGKPDLFVGIDNWNYNPNRGGDSFFWTNNGTPTPYSTTPAKLTSYNYPTFYDYDVGFAFDYDHDPSGTLDMMIADGNHSSSFYIQANRVVPQYVACGDAASGVIEPQVAANGEAVVTGARITPTATLNGGTITYYLSNEDPPNWVAATPCAGSSTDLCATFPKPVGRQVRWKATMCSNNARTTTPVLTRVGMKFDYTPARDYFRAGVVLNDGVAYLGGFRQPGDRGHLFALDAGLTQTYWDAATAIDAANDSNRKIYTSDATATTRVDFTTANASSAALIAALNAGSAAQAASVVAWARSKRFGVGNTGIESSRLGAIETSTPAVLTPPGAPVWFTNASLADRTRFQTYQNAHKARPTLVLFGSKDGMIHAIRTVPSAISTAPSGTEAWAFVPPKVAAGMLTDYTNSLATGTTSVASYPDGSPTLADYKRLDGSYGTVAIVAGGNGGKSLVALDVTNTITTGGAVVGPTPLWTVTPGEADAGQAFSKPAVARVKINDRERFVAIAATGVARDNPAAPFTKGRLVTAYDVATGALLWKFQAQCAVTSDISVFETDDPLEPGAPRLDGYIDRAVFADACGYVYKLVPGVDRAGGWNVNRDLGAIAVAAAGTEPVPQYALFSTLATSGALGRTSAIGGTLAVRADNSERMVLFFGTGGVESQAVGQANEFYAVYADTGAVRSKVAGSCTSSGCEKFYGGVVTTSEQVVFTRTVDPTVGTSTCDLGSTTIQAFALNATSGGDFVTDFTQTTGSAVMGALYGDAGAIYFAMLSGGVSRIGTPRAATAGTDTRAPTNAPTPTGALTTSEALVLMGWIQNY